MLIRPRKGQRPPPPCSVYHALGCRWHLLPEGARRRWAVWAMGRYHDLSRRCCLLPRCCQGDAMNFDLKRSWLGATLVQQGRVDFSIWVLRGCTEVGSWLRPKWPVQLSGATDMNWLEGLYICAGRSPWTTKITTTTFLLLKGLIHFLGNLNFSCTVSNPAVFLYSVLFRILFGLPYIMWLISKHDHANWGHLYFTLPRIILHW